MAKRKTSAVVPNSDDDFGLFRPRKQRPMSILPSQEELKADAGFWWERSDVPEHLDEIERNLERLIGCVSPETVKAKRDAEAVAFERAKAKSPPLREAVWALRILRRDLRPAIAKGELLIAVGAALRLGYALCRVEVLPHDDAAKIGKRTRKGAAKGLATKTSKAVQRREDTQQAVRDRWTKNPKLSLSAIQQALAKVDGKPFGMLRTIEKNTVGMKPAK